MGRVTIFHTSDIHNKLTPELAERLRRLKSETPNSLMLDSGDAIWAGNVFWRPGGEPVLDLMNEVPYDAMCMGNREFHFLRAGLEAKTSRARFPILSSNLRGIRDLGFEIWDLGMRVGVFGLSVPCITQRMAIKRVAECYFEGPIKTAGEVVPQLRERCDLVVALTHIGIKIDRQLAEKVEGIDLILGGHTHTVTEQHDRVGDTWIVHHGSRCKLVGRVDVDVSDGRVDVRNELIPLAGA